MTDAVPAASDDLARLRLDNQRLASALDAAGDGIACLQHGDDSLTLNAGFLALWNLDAGSHAGRSGDSLDNWLATRVRDPDSLLARAAYARRHPGYEGCHRVELLDGRTFEQRVRPLQLDGQCAGNITTWHDISELLRAQDDRRKATDFIAGITTALRTPMHAIAGLSHLALKSAPDSRQRGYIARLQACGQQLLGIVNDSLHFSATGRARPAGSTGVESAAGPAAAEPADIRGSRVLLVEDNDINQQVARELLEQAGMLVDVAEHGAMALEMVGKTAYDLVFMDVQMPVMDGLSATRALRQLAGFSELPVIAMTASAQPQDRRDCMEAGMNDFLGKPVDQAALGKMLQRWLGPQPAATTTATVPVARAPRPRPHAAATPPSALPRGIRGLDTALGLTRMAGKEPLYLAMLRRYAAGQKTQGAGIRAALAAHDLATAERLAHTTNGVSGTVGACIVQKHAAALEQALREKLPIDEVRLRLVELEIPLLNLVAALEQQLPPATAEMVAA